MLNLIITFQKKLVYKNTNLIIIQKIKNIKINLLENNTNSFKKTNNIVALRFI